MHAYSSGSWETDKEPPHNTEKNTRSCGTKHTNASAPQVKQKGAFAYTQTIHRLSRVSGGGASLACILHWTGDRTTKSLSNDLPGEVGVTAPHDRTSGHDVHVCGSKVFKE